MGKICLLGKGGAKHKICNIYVPISFIKEDKKMHHLLLVEGNHVARGVASLGTTPQVPNMPPFKL